MSINLWQKKIVNVGHNLVTSLFALLEPHFINPMTLTVTFETTFESILYIGFMTVLCQILICS